MTPTQVEDFLRRIVEGQTIRVTTASNRIVDGVFDGERTNSDWLYFEDMDGRELKAAWGDVASVDYRSARMTAGKMMVPPEHPLSGQGPVRYGPNGTPLKPHTSRNR